MKKDLDILVAWMVQNAVDGTFHGSPQKLINHLGDTNLLHEDLMNAGIYRIGENGTEAWLIPSSLLKEEAFHAA